MFIKDPAASEHPGRRPEENGLVALLGDSSVAVLLPYHSNRLSTVEEDAGLMSGTTGLTNDARLSGPLPNCIDLRVTSPSAGDAMPLYILSVP